MTSSSNYKTFFFKNLIFCKFKQVNAWEICMNKTVLSHKPKCLNYPIFSEISLMLSNQIDWFKLYSLLRPRSNKNNFNFSLQFV